MRSNPKFWKTTQRFFGKKHAKIKFKKLKITKKSSSNPALRESPNQFYNVKTGIRGLVLKEKLNQTPPISHVIGMPTGKKKNTRWVSESVAGIQRECTTYKLQFENCKHSADSQRGRCFRPWLDSTDDNKTNSMWVPVSLHRLDRISAPKSKRTSLNQLVSRFRSFKSVSKFLPTKLSVSAKVILSQFACSSKKKTSAKLSQSGRNIIKISSIFSCPHEAINAWFVW